MRKLFALIFCAFMLSAASVQAASLCEGEGDALYPNTIPQQGELGLGIYGEDETYSQLELLCIQTWQNFDESVDITELYIEESVFNEYYPKILFAHPEYAYVNPNWGYNYWDYTKELGYVYHEIASIYPKYNVSTKEEAEELMEEVELGATKALFNITPQMSDFQIAMELHDYMVLHSAYDLRVYSEDEEENAQTVRTTRLLADGTGVCQAYALTYKYLLNRMGIECEYISSEGMNHGWNVVKLDGNWYHVDLTKDDALLTNDDGDYFDQSGCVDHAHSFLSNDAAQELGYTGYELNGIQVNSTKYDDAPWREYTKSPVVCSAGKTYYFSNNKLYDEDGNIIVSRVVMNSTGNWPIYMILNMTGPFCGGMCEYNGNIYYSTGNAIKYFDPQNPKTIKTLKQSLSGVAGLYVVDNKIVYSHYVYYKIGRYLVSEYGGEIEIDDYRVSNVGIYPNRSSVNIYNAKQSSLNAYIDTEYNCYISEVAPSSYRTLDAYTRVGSFFLWDTNMSPVIPKQSFGNYNE